MLLSGNLAAQTETAGALPDPQQAAVRRMVDYLESNLNTLGDPKVPSPDKDILITESFQKLFRDASVQVEDDLASSRSTITYKDAPAYLLDVDFFFRSVRFEYTIQEIESQTAQSGEESWLVRSIRNLKGIDFSGENVQNDQERFIEINRTPDGLKIVSIYSTKLNRNEANRLWWANLTPAWKSLLAGDAELISGLPLQSVSAYHDAMLASARDTFLLPGYPNSGYKLDSGNVFFFGDTVSVAGYTTLPVEVEAIDAFLEGLLAMRELNLENRILPDLNSLSPLKMLRVLNLAGTSVADLSPLRSMNQLEELNISGTKASDLSPLRYAKNLRRLEADQSGVTGELPAWPDLEYLTLSGCPLDSFWSPGEKPALEYLDVSESSLSSLDRFAPLPRLEHIDLSRTGIRNLDPLASSTSLRVFNASDTRVSNLHALRNMAQLERVHVDGTAIGSLEALSAKPNLQRIYCDGTGITDSLARVFHRNNPGVLIVHETAYLQQWWNKLPATWQASFSKEVSFQGNPDKETLHAISALRSLNLSDNTDLSSLEPLRELPELEFLDLSGTALSDYDLLRKLHSLRELKLNNTAVSDLEMLSELSNLHTLYLENTEVAHLKPLQSCTRLERIFADNSAVGDSALFAFETRKPETLVVVRSKEHGQWWASLPEGWKELLATATGFTGIPEPESLARIRHIQELSIPPGDFESLEPLAFLTRLKTLRFAGNRISSLAPLQKISRLEVVDATGNPVLSLEGLQSHQQLRDLKADNTPIRDLEPIARSMMLERLSVAGSEIKSLQPLILNRRLVYLDCSNTRVRNLAPIEEMETLRDLIIFNTDMSTGKVEQFKKLHPSCNVRFY